MGISDSVYELFGSTDLLTACLWCVGFIIFSVEFFQPMRGAAYSAGIILLGASFILRITTGTPGEAFVYVFFTVIAMFVLHIVSLKTNRLDWLRVSGSMRKDNKSSEYAALVGKTGVAGTKIDLTGSIVIDDVNLVVYAKTPIATGEKVIITEVAADKIIVERYDAKSETIITSNVLNIE